MIKIHCNIIRSYSLQTSLFHDSSFRRSFTTSAQKISMRRSDVQKTLSRLNGMIAGNGGRGWINWLLKIPIIIRGGNSAALVRSAVVFIRACYNLYKCQGRSGLCIYTKNCYVLTMQTIAGMKVKSVHPLGGTPGRSRSGLPQIIPRVHRIRILQGDKFLLRIWLSWFSIYRVLVPPSKLKLSTIVDPGLDLSRLWGQLGNVLPGFSSGVLKVSAGSLRSQLKLPTFFPLEKTSPSIPSGRHKESWSPKGIVYGAVALLQNPSVLSAFHTILDFYSPTTYKFKGVWNQMERLARLCPPSIWSFNLGKLGFKVEPAGKVRVFAMVECWTQWLLNPLHKLLFRKLSQLPTDGTFDQLAPINRLIESGYTRFWCYDLSAATDRLPVDIQAQLLDYLFGDSFGLAWKHLLVSREYALPAKLPKGILPDKTYLTSSAVKYSVGQPMGALSSWAMLALVHHLLVNWAAYRVGWKWGSFTAYAVLGDDIVIANGNVAGSYLQLMKAVGVEIGLHKSLVSRKGVLEFAKRFIVNSVDVSPVPFKELVPPLHEFASLTQLILKYQLGLSSIAAFLGFGYKVRGRLLSDYNVLNRRLLTIAKWRTSPWGPMALYPKAWLNITSLRIKPEWLRVDKFVWPDLGEAYRPLSDYIKKAAKAAILKYQNEVMFKPLSRGRTGFGLGGFMGGPMSTPFGGFGGGGLFGLDNLTGTSSVAKSPGVGLTGSLQSLQDWHWRKVPSLIKWFESEHFAKHAAAFQHPGSGLPGYAIGMLAQVFQFIQEIYWDDSYLTLKADLEEAFTFYHNVKFDAGKDLSKSAFDDFIKARSKGSLIKELHKWGEKRMTRIRPGVLYLASLYDKAHPGEKKSAVVPGNVNLKKSGLRK